ncbi:zinc finger, CCHC-type containing protein [Tanacetum coccineum]
MSDDLFDVYQNVESAKELWDQLEAKYMAEDTSSKKFLVSNFNNYRMVDSSIINKLPPSWKDFKHMLKHNKDELSLVQHEAIEVCLLLTAIEETLRMEEKRERQGIIHQTMAPYTPQQNGVSVRKNRALKEMAVVRLPEPKKKNLGEKGIDCIFIGYVEHSKAYRFYVIEPNYFVFVNLVIESKDAIFDENRFSSIPRPKDIVSSSNGTQGCKWIFKKKKKVDGTIDKFKARLVIQGFRQKERIDYFDTYAPVARISTIRLLISLAATHNLMIHQMDVKTTFLNGDLEEEIYMKQPEGFVMPGRGAISWASKKQTCITDSTMESEFVALATTGKEAEYFNIWGSEVRKKEHAYEEEKYAAACRYMLSVTCDDEDDYIPLGGDIYGLDIPYSNHYPTYAIKSPENDLSKWLNAATYHYPSSKLEEKNEDHEEKEFEFRRYFSIQDVIRREKLLNDPIILISKNESLKDNPTPLIDHTEETRSGSTTTHANYSLPEYESFHFDNPSLPRPPPEPPDIEILKPEINNFDVLYNDESFEPEKD